MNYDAYYSYHTTNLDAQTSQASPVQLVIILMDGLLEELARARAHIEAKRFEEKARSLDKCINILNGLSSALDTESENEVVVSLGHLYEFCAGHLYKAGFSMNPALIDEVVELLTVIRNGWKSVQDRGE